MNDTDAGLYEKSHTCRRCGEELPEHCDECLEAILDEGMRRLAEERANAQRMRMIPEAAYERLKTEGHLP